MTKAELKLITYLLDLAAEVFANRVCNDLPLQADVGLTPEEAREVHDKIEAWQSQDDPSYRAEPYNDGFATDWLAAHAMADRARAEAEK